MTKRETSNASRIGTRFSTVMPKTERVVDLGQHGSDWILLHPPVDDAHVVLCQIQRSANRQQGQRHGVRTAEGYKNDFLTKHDWLI